MKLDKRIKRGKKPLTPLDIEKAYEFIGKLCLFSNYASYFENFDLVDPRANFYQLRGINEKTKKIVRFAVWDFSLTVILDIVYQQNG